MAVSLGVAETLACGGLSALSAVAAPHHCRGGGAATVLKSLCPERCPQEPATARAQAEVAQ